MPQSTSATGTKPDQADANAELVRAVYAKLHRTRPDGFRYTTLRLDDQVTFVHITQSRTRRLAPSPGQRRSVSSRQVSGTGATSPRSRRPLPKSVPTASLPASRINRHGDDLLPRRRGLQAEGSLSGRGVHDEVVAELVLGLAHLSQER